MKKTNKTLKIFLYALAVITVIFAILSLSSFTSGDSAEEYIAEKDASENQSDAGEAENDKNFFDTLYSGFEENSDKILSALSFFSSIVLMFFYKKGLLPSVEGTIKTLVSNVRSVSDAAANLSKDNDKLGELLGERLNCAEHTLTLIGDTLGKLEEKLNSEAEREDEQKAFKTVMSAEIDLLYEIFMAADLPHYLKENVGERISEMKAKLRENK